ncbi:MAG: hypothetical protein WCS94_03745, partial [Verrucomicrobiota bacterium]
LLFACLMFLTFACFGWSTFVLNQDVTPAYVREHPLEFSVHVEGRTNEIVVYTIVRHTQKVLYIYPRISVWRDRKFVGSTRQPSPSTITNGMYIISFSAAWSDAVSLTIRESLFADPDANKKPFTGGTDYVLQLEDFKGQLL